MSKTLLLRMVGMIVFAIVGAWLGSEVGGLFVTSPSAQNDPRLPAQLATVLFLAGLAFGAIVTPYITVGPYFWFRGIIKQIPAQYLLAGTIGLGIYGSVQVAGLTIDQARERIRAFLAEVTKVAAQQNRIGCQCNTGNAQVHRSQTRTLAFQLGELILRL